jgi:hypothetical protein
MIDLCHELTRLLRQIGLLWLLSLRHLRLLRRRLLLLSRLILARNAGLRTLRGR